ncbi:uncharacterized protein LOC108672826 [Hyalella azteca]|uniref:Uncharacterized protein LOC108672826 n=1 Tax=Hyalella azteca TaxID=294128 RepID=A0A979FT40_HYAAZ|nr:uncharacterized protein LOC108672826 [Hyalella azteca]
MSAAVAVAAVALYRCSKHQQQKQPRLQDQTVFAMSGRLRSVTTTTLLSPSISSSRRADLCPSTSSYLHEDAIYTSLLPPPPSIPPRYGPTPPHVLPSSIRFTGDQYSAVTHPPYTKTSATLAVNERKCIPSEWVPQVSLEEFRKLWKHLEVDGSGVVVKAVLRSGRYAQLCSATLRPNTDVLVKVAHCSTAALESHAVRECSAAVQLTRVQHPAVLAVIAFSAPCPLMLIYPYKGGRNLKM